MAHKLTVSSSDDGRRLDKVLRSIWPGLPLSVVMKGIRTGSVRLDGKKASCDVRVSAGQEIYDRTVKTNEAITQIAKGEIEQVTAKAQAEAEKVVKTAAKKARR